VSAHLAALAVAFAVVAGVGIYMLVNIPLFYAACGVVALVVLLAAVGLDADGDSSVP
jgi:peptidoglycan/LPS O-acetylase OafA/YrhL